MWIDQLKNYVGIAQGIATILAFGLGGWWTWWSFIRTRQRHPKVRLSHTLFQSQTNDKWMLLRVSLKIDNQSNVLIRPGSVEMRLLRLKPWPPGLEAAMEESAPSNLPSYKDLLDDRGMLRKGKPDFEWPVIATRIVIPEKLEIEPNESETLHFDFVVDRRWQIVLIYSFVENLRKRRQGIGWPLTSIFEVTQGEGTNARGTQKT